MKVKPLVNSISHAGPPLAFLLGFYQGGLMMATLAVVVATPLALLLHYMYHRELPIMPMVTCGFVLFFGGLTLMLDNPQFIKMRPTVVNGVFAMLLAGSLLAGKLWVKKLMGAQLPLPDEAWKQLSWRMVGLFLALGTINEVVWRHTSDEVWVNIKLFGLPLLMVMFFVAHFPFFQKYMPQTEKSNESNGA